MTNSTIKICPKCGKRALRANGTHLKGDGTKVQKWTCRKTTGDREYCYSTIDPDKPYRDQVKRPRKNEDVRKKFRRKLHNSKYIIFTAAQNATPTHMGFWNSLKALASHYDADLAVIPLRYKNPTSMFTESQRNEEHWLRDVAAAELGTVDIASQDAFAKTYLYEQRKKLNDNLVVVGDVKTQPTRSDPLTSMEGFTHGESGIFGHTKIRMKCVATPQGRLPKILTTTGAVTVPNYTDSTAGKKGEFHHVLGAVLVEIESPTKFHLHHINAVRDGTFIFKRRMYHPDGTETKAPRDKAMIFGDAHHRFADPKVVNATFGKGGLVDLHDPEMLVCHDLLDCYWGNPHHKDNPFIKKAKHSAGFHVAENEVRETIKWLEKATGDRPVYIVPSNHDDMFARWVIREDWKELDPENMEFYLETALQMARSAKMSETGAQYLDPFCYWVTKLAGDHPRIVPMHVNQSLLVGDIECGYHGDQGPGGARGTVKNLSQIGVKVISGHGHSPAIQDGHVRVGTMTRLTAEYVKGPNDWLNAHASIDALGKRHLHFCIDGKFYSE